MYKISHIFVKAMHTGLEAEQEENVYRSICTIPLQIKMPNLYTYPVGPDSSVGIATELRAGRSGDRLQVGARFSTRVQTGPLAHPASCTMGTGSFPEVKCGRDVTLTPHLLLVPW